VIPDSAVFAIMPKINKVIIGTRAIMANGGLISYNGVYNVCLCASMFSIPVIVVGGTFKLTPMYPFTHETFNEFISPDKIYNSDYKEDISNIKFNTPAYDYVPSEFISIYLTNHGSQNPAYIYRLFAELYSQEDYFL
jgi:translation initiation factor eIF-2B subunit beta